MRGDGPTPRGAPKRHDDKLAGHESECFNDRFCWRAVGSGPCLRCFQAPLGPDTVVATVAGTNLTNADIHKMLEGSSPQAAQSFQANPQGTIQQLFLMRYLASEGEKLKLAESSPYKEQLEFTRATVLASLMLNHERDGLPRQRRRHPEVLRS